MTRSLRLGALTIVALLTIVGGAVADPGRYEPIAVDGPAVRVCIIDSGVADGTPGVVERLTATGSLEPGAPHGTTMTAIIRTAYPAAQIVSVQRNDGRTSTMRIGDLVDLCIAHGAQVVSMSFVIRDAFNIDGFPEAIARARAAGAVAIGAAGNSGVIEAPASTPGVVGVGAADAAGNTCSFSASSPDLVMALGCEVEALGSMGTSNATAYVAGIAAALIAHGANGTQVESQLRSTPLVLGTRLPLDDEDQDRAQPQRPAAGDRGHKHQTVRFRVRRLSGRRLRVSVIGRERGDLLFTRIGRHERMWRSGTVTIRLPRSARRCSLSLTSEHGRIARRTIHLPR